MFGQLQPGAQGARAEPGGEEAGMTRWWVYQRERFPVLAHGPLVAAFSLSAVSFSRLLRGQTTLPGATATVVAFVTCLLFFLQLRIADEFKDFEEDSKYRPYRAVPRGLVSLPELGVLGAITAAIQALLAIWLDPSLLILLAVAWAYLALMSKEFFVGDWLKRHHGLYLVSHMMIMPLVDLYATACDWWADGASAPPGLIWFLIVSYFNGVNIEVGRKIRAPKGEEHGVNTYSAVWGLRPAVLIWLGDLVVTAACAAWAAHLIGWLEPTAVALALLLLTAATIAASFVRQPTKGGSKAIEATAGVWTLVMYLALGATPLAWRWWHSS
jgi:4-hydroxybenzoate polyprenyltransferase